jgi:ClpP class serine protease
MSALSPEADMVIVGINVFIFFVLLALMALQPLVMGRWYAMQRTHAIRAIEKEHRSRVITMIHRQEKRSLFGFSVRQLIDVEDAQTVIAAIKETPDDVPIDFIIHTSGGIGAGRNANCSRSRSASGKSDGVRAGLCDVRRHSDCSRCRRNRIG